MNIFLLPILLISNTEMLSVELTPDNHVSIKGRIDDQMASKFISKINQINSTHIYIYIDSHGGSVDSGHKMIQYMNFKRESNHTLLCIAQQADSMAFHIFQFCNHRYILQNSKMMQHQMSIHNLSGNIEQLLHYIRVSYKMYENLILQGSQRIGLSTSEYKQKINDDWYLYGEDIIKNRVADAMISSIGCNQALTKGDSVIIVNDKIIRVSECPIV